MKEKELRDIATCHICGNKIGACGIPTFYRVRIQHWGLKLDAMQRQTGMEMMMNGHVALAQIMGADEDMATQLGDDIEITVCHTCSYEEALPIMVSAEDEE